MSKRSQDMQLSGDGVPFHGSGTETPTDTPSKATAAQMARRKIATLKTRTARSTSPVKTTAAFPGFSTPQPGPEPQQSGFSFGQNGASGATSTNFGFGPPQSNASSSFSFSGQPQPGGTNGFTFGQSQTQQNGGFSFGSTSSGTSLSFPPAGSSNPFSANGAGTSNQNSGFSGSIFSIPSPTISSQPQSMRNGFSFGATSSSPQTPLGVGISEADKQIIISREPYLNSSQQKRLEEIVGSSLPDATSAYQKDPLEMIPQQVTNQIVEYLRSLPAAPIGSSPNVESLFVRPFRNKSKLSWVSDDERNEIQKTAVSLSPADMDKVAQIARDNVESLKSMTASELPGVDRLPNDVQRQMLDFIRQASASGATTPQKPQNIFALSNQTPEQSSSPGVEPSKANPFSSIKITPKAPAQTSTGISFGTQANTGSKLNGQSASPAPSFSFTKPIGSTPVPPTTSNVESSKADDPKPNPFASVARPSTSFGAPARVEPTTPKNVFGSTEPSNVDKPASSPFKNFQTNGQDSPNPVATPQATKPTFTFAQSTAKTPAPSSSNIFNLSATNPPATAPVQKTGSFTGFGNSPQPALTASATQTANPPLFQPTANKDSSTFERGAVSSSALTSLQKFNMAFRQHLESLQSADDWSGTMKFYLREAQKLKQAKPQSKLGHEEVTRAVAPPSSFSFSASTTNDRPSGFSSSANSQPIKATPGFQISSPQKPLSATASLFSNILDSPEKPKEAALNPMTAPVSPNPTHSFLGAAQSPFKPTTPTTSTPVQNDASTPLQIPKFGAATSGTEASGLPKFGGGSSANFLSAFGAQAAKEAEKDKAKRKAEDFDSDEDDEAEWERQDQEKQAAKKRALAQKSKKVMKNVNGKFEWVDADEETPVPQATAATPAKASSGLDGATSPSVFSNLSSPAPPAISNPFAHLSRSQSPIGTIEQNDDQSQSSNGVGEEDTDEEDGENIAPEHGGSNAPSTPARSGSLFDRIEKNVDGSNTTPKPLFSFTKTSPAASPAGDNTWKPESPIKFGASGTSNGSTTPIGSPAKNPFSFGPKADDVTSDEPVSSTPTFKFGGNTPKFDFGNSASAGDAPKPFSGFFSATPAGGSVSPSPSPSIFAGLQSAQSSSAAKGASGAGFNFGGPSASLAPGAATHSAGTSVFGSQATSRATTPGATTADESSTVAGTDNEEDSTPAEEQRNLTSLTAEEQQTEDVLFEHKARCRKFIRGADGSSHSWENKGVGILRVLKNKETGNPRVLMRLDPSGTILMNANIIKGGKMYSMSGEKMVRLVFAEAEGELVTYAAQFGTKEKAEQLLDVITGVI